jgi:hypothetical protein
MMKGFLAILSFGIACLVDAAPQGLTGKNDDIWADYDALVSTIETTTPEILKAAAPGSERYNILGRSITKKYRSGSILNDSPPTGVIGKRERGCQARRQCSQQYVAIRSIALRTTNTGFNRGRWKGSRSSRSSSKIYNSPASERKDTRSRNYQSSIWSLQNPQCLQEERDGRGWNSFQLS